MEETLSRDGVRKGTTYLLFQFHETDKNTKIQNNILRAASRNKQKSPDFSILSFVHFLLHCVPYFQVVYLLIRFKLFLRVSYLLFECCDLLFEFCTFYLNFILFIRVSYLFRVLYLLYEFLILYLLFEIRNFLLGFLPFYKNLVNCTKEMPKV